MKILITGAAGFVGTNLSLALAHQNHELMLIDDLSRPLVSNNRDYIETSTRESVRLLDITDFNAMSAMLRDFGIPDLVVNLAGQVSLMASIENPLRDFSVNVHAPLWLLNYFRTHDANPIFINISSNKVYGALSNYNFVESEFRYELIEGRRSFDESTPLDFYGPYGCSKGAADQYLMDFARIYGMRTVSFRQSTIYGPFQRPTSDQGWVVFMVDQILEKKTIDLNGIGKQVRDILHVDDLVELILKIPTLADFPYGDSFNVGGGEENSLSILELFRYVFEKTGLEASYRFGAERPGDQKYYVSNIAKISNATGWSPRINVTDGLADLISRKLL